MDNPIIAGLVMTLGLPVAGAILLGLIAKYFPRQKCADVAWKWVKMFLDFINPVLCLKIGKKLAEQVEESILGTIGYVLHFLGEKIALWLLENDSDSSCKGK